MHLHLQRFYTTQLHSMFCIQFIIFGSGVISWPKWQMTAVLDVLQRHFVTFIRSRLSISYTTCSSFLSFYDIILPFRDDGDIWVTWVCSLKWFFQIHSSIWSWSCSSLRQITYSLSSLRSEFYSWPKRFTEQNTDPLNKKRMNQETKFRFGVYINKNTEISVV